MEILTTDNMLLTMSILLFVSIFMSKAGTRYGLPTLLLFLLAGILFGSDGLGIHFEDAEQAQSVGMVALSVILFAGGMDTRFRDIRPVVWQGITLSTMGVLLTTLTTGFFIWWLSGQSWTNIHFTLIASLLLAATMSSTDSASVFAILRERRMNLRYNLRPMLELESGSNDPMAYMLTVVLIGVAMSDTSGIGWGGILLAFVRQFAVGGLLGYLIGRFCAFAINKMHVSNAALYPIMLLSFVFFTYSFTDMMGGNGYLAVYIAGMMVGNRQVDNRREINHFMEVLTWLMQIIMFICLGLLVNPHEMLDVTLVSILIAAFVILVGRPVSVFLSLLPFGKKLTVKSRLFVSWVGLRGAAPIIFATYPVVAGVPGGDKMFNIVFFITLLSLVVQGATLHKVAHKFGLSLPANDAPENFGVELPDELGSTLAEQTLTKDDVARASTLAEMALPTHKRVIMIRRKGRYLMPTGTLTLKAGDTLLVMEMENSSPTTSPQSSPADEGGPKLP